MVIFSVSVRYCSLEEDRENIFHCDFLAQRAVFHLKYIWIMERAVKNYVSNERRIVELKKCFQD